MAERLDEIVEEEFKAVRDAANCALSSENGAFLYINPSVPTYFVEIYDGDNMIVECYFSLNQNARTATIDTLYVDADYRFNGIGSSVARAIESICEQSGIEEISLYPKDESARLFWTKQGYVEDSSFDELMVKYI